MTREADSIERMRRSLSAAGDGAKPREDCPPASRLWQAAAGELPSREVEELTDHVTTCLLCGPLWEMARELQAGSARVAAAGASREVRPEGGGWWRYGRVAAALLVLTAALALLWPRGLDPGVPPSDLRGDGSGLELGLPEQLPREDFRLRWQGGPAGSVYSVLVVWSTAERQQVLDRQQGLEAAEYRVPPEKLVAVPSGSKLRITVGVRLRGVELGSESAVVALE